MTNEVDNNDDEGDDYFDYGDEWDNVDSWEAKQTRDTGYLSWDEDFEDDCVPPYNDHET